MKSYWDLSEKDRAALTRDEVERYQNIELMTKGVLKAPAAPALVPVPERPPPTIAYGVDGGDIVYFDRDLAVRAAAGAYIKVTDWELGHRVHVARPAGRVVEHEVYTEAQASSFRATLLDRNAAEEANRKIEEEHRAACKAEREALADLWNDWQRCRNLDVAHRRVVTTFDEYVGLTGGDRVMAARFLRKRFTAAEIADAAAWCWAHIPSDSEIADRTNRVEETRP